MVPCRASGIFQSCAVTRDLKTLDDFLQKKYDVNTVNEYGETALFVASYKGDNLVVDILLQNYADPNIQTREGNTALHAAASNSHVDILAKLIRVGGDVRLANLSGERVRDMIWDCRESAGMDHLLQDYFDLAEHVSCGGFIGESGASVDLEDVSYGKPPSSAGSETSLIDYFKAGSNNNNAECITRDNKTMLSHNKQLPCNIAVAHTGFGSFLCKNNIALGYISHIPLINNEIDLKYDKGAVDNYHNEAFTETCSMQWRGTPVSVKQVRLQHVHPREPKLIGLLLNQPIRELQFLSYLRHPNFLTLMGISATYFPHNTEVSLALVFERAHLGSLYHHLHIKDERLPRISGLTILRQIMEAVIFLHNSSVIHCAISSHAVHLVAPDVAKLGNFEYAIDKPSAPMHISRDSRTPLSPTSSGHLPRSLAALNTCPNAIYNWLSPELLQPHVPISTAADVYSLGVLIWETLTGSLPHKDIPPEDIFAHWRPALLPDDLDIVQIPAALRPAIRSTQYAEPRDRISTDQLHKVVIYAFWNDYDELHSPRRPVTSSSTDCQSQEDNTRIPPTPPSIHHSKPPVVKRYSRSHQTARSHQPSVGGMMKLLGDTNCLNNNCLDTNYMRNSRVLPTDQFTKSNVDSCIRVETALIHAPPDPHIGTKLGEASVNLLQPGGDHLSPLVKSKRVTQNSVKILDDHLSESDVFVTSLDDTEHFLYGTEGIDSKKANCYSKWLPPRSPRVIEKKISSVHKEQASKPVLKHYRTQSDPIQKSSYLRSSSADDIAQFNGTGSSVGTRPGRWKMNKEAYIRLAAVPPPTNPPLYNHRSGARSSFRDAPTSSHTSRSRNTSEEDNSVKPASHRTCRSPNHVNVAEVCGYPDLIVEGTRSLRSPTPPPLGFLDNKISWKPPEPPLIHNPTANCHGFRPVVSHSSSSHLPPRPQKAAPYLHRYTSQKEATPGHQPILKENASHQTQSISDSRENNQPSDKQFPKVGSLIESFEAKDRYYRDQVRSTSCLRDRKLSVSRGSSSDRDSDQPRQYPRVDRDSDQPRQYARVDRDSNQPRQYARADRDSDQPRQFARADCDSDQPRQFARADCDSDQPRQYIREVVSPVCSQRGDMVDKLNCILDRQIKSRSPSPISGGRYFGVEKHVNPEGNSGHTPKKPQVQLCRSIKLQESLQMRVDKLCKPINQWKGEGNQDPFKNTDNRTSTPITEQSNQSGPELYQYLSSSGLEATVDDNIGIGILEPGHVYVEECSPLKSVSTHLNKGNLDLHCQLQDPLHRQPREIKVVRANGRPVHKEACQTGCVKRKDNDQSFCNTSWDNVSPSCVWTDDDRREREWIANNNWEQTDDNASVTYPEAIKEHDKNKHNQKRTPPTIKKKSKETINVNPKQSTKSSKHKKTAVIKNTEISNLHSTKIKLKRNQSWDNIDPSQIWEDMEDKKLPNDADRGTMDLNDWVFSNTAQSEGNEDDPTSEGFRSACQFLSPASMDSDPFFNSGRDSDNDSFFA